MYWEKCEISLLTGDQKFVGIVKDIEAYWVKIEEENGIRMINGVSVRDIKILEK